jgi:hypothetical protein
MTHSGVLIIDIGNLNLSAAICRCKALGMWGFILGAGLECRDFVLGRALSPATSESKEKRGEGTGVVTDNPPANLPKTPSPTAHVIRGKTTSVQWREAGGAEWVSRNKFICPSGSDCR